MRAIQLFLLALIILGIGLIATQKRWVPVVVGYILEEENIDLYQYEKPFVPHANSTRSTNNTISPKPYPTPAPIVIDSGVKGRVMIGPTCPVVRYPEDPACADKPYKTTLIISSTEPGKGGGILVNSDSLGNFSKLLNPGTYTIQGGENVVMPRLTPVTFIVEAHKQTILNLQFDSGIR